MLSLDKAVQRITPLASPRVGKRVPLSSACGRILSQDIFSDVDMPPFHKSAMDGYACLKEDLTAATLRRVEQIAAGDVPQNRIVTGTCAKIMTGAKVPEGAEVVFRMEDSEELGEGNVRCISPETKSNICVQGEDVGKGETVLWKGSRLRPPEIALLAATGTVDVPVYDLPTVGILATGSELVEPSDTPRGTAIRNSNSSQLFAQLKAVGIQPSYLGIVSDTKRKIQDEAKDAFAQHDVLFITGGASQGDYDFVSQVLQDMGFNILFSELAIQPGKPCSFATQGNKYCFGLSGNPVSSLLQFELLAKPFLLRMMGYVASPPTITCRLKHRFQRKNSRRALFLPVTIDHEGKAVVSNDYHGSAHIAAYTTADGFVEIPQGVSCLDADAHAFVRLL